MDKIYLKGMEFYCYHGVFPEENKLGQRYEADVTLECDTKPAGTTDDLSQTVNYAQVYEITKEVMEADAVNLVETLTERIAEKLLHQFAMVEAVIVKVIKPNPPIPGHYESVAVEIRREREN